MENKNQQYNVYYMQELIEMYVKKSMYTAQNTYNMLDKYGYQVGHLDNEWCRLKTQILSDNDFLFSLITAIARDGISVLKCYDKSIDTMNDICDTINHQKKLKNLAGIYDNVYNNDKQVNNALNDIFVAIDTKLKENCKYIAELEDKIEKMEYKQNILNSNTTKKGIL